jgi:hypothetical protein
MGRGNIFWESPLTRSHNSRSSGRRRVASHGARPRAFPPQVEPLEDRCLLSGGLDLGFVDALLRDLTHGAAPTVERRAKAVSGPQAAQVKAPYHAYRHQAPTAAQLKQGVALVAPEKVAHPRVFASWGGVQICQVAFSPEAGTSRRPTATAPCLSSAWHRPKKSAKKGDRI